ncbi:SDR family NAD(P)-dependent oxidoreductase [Streptomyces caniferus]|uniref:SDR family NAD(P)-dependent oxidoreductase n=1 Tax=Streptomyces caniferus TaxID=285557 RepID=UPI0034518684
MVTVPDSREASQPAGCFRRTLSANAAEPGQLTGRPHGERDCSAPSPVRIGPGRSLVTQAALPFLRARGSGHIVQVSSIGGLAAFPTLGLYNASKWALEGMSEALAQEVAPLGIHVTIVEPGPFGTDWSGSSAVHTEPIAAYEPVREARRAGATARAPQDPQATADVILELVDTDEPPLRLFLGTYPYPVVEAAYKQRLDIWNAWRPLAAKA